MNGARTHVHPSVLKGTDFTLTQVVGMDPDTDRLQLAKEKYSAPNLTYQEGKAEDISGGNYDVVFSNFVLHWCEDKDIVFKQVMRSLKEGGKFGFVCS